MVKAFLHPSIFFYVLDFYLILDLWGHFSCFIVFHSTTHIIYFNMVLWNPMRAVVIMGKITYKDDSPSYDC